MASENWATLDVAKALYSISKNDGNKFDYGIYQSAIDRWEFITGAPSPCPLEKKRLSPEFAEWMMGFPIGWTGDHSATQRLKMLGNAVVPHQGALALWSLLKRREVTNG